MPQMSPLHWSFTLLMFLLINFVMMNNFNKTSQLNKNKKTIKKNNFILKW